MSVNLFSSINNFEERLFEAVDFRYPHSDELKIYHNNSILPIYPLLKYEQQKKINEFKLLDSIYCFKIDDPQFKGIVENLEISNLKSTEDLKKLIIERNNGYNILKKRFLKIFTKYQHEEENYIHDLYIGSPNQITTTIEFDKKCGLHYDNWGRLPISQLEKAQNRICINLGKGHRYFIYINKTIFEMREELIQIDKKFIEIEDSNELGQFYFKIISPLNYKIIFFKLEPFEGYIAPTENIMHDGSNFDSKFVDIQFTARGLFSPNLIK